MKIFPFPSMLVGMTRFELATSGPPDRCATGLRHIPSSECACKKKLQQLIRKLVQRYNKNCKYTNKTYIFHEKTTDLSLFAN